MNGKPEIWGRFRRAVGRILPERLKNHLTKYHAKLLARFKYNYSLWISENEPDAQELSKQTRLAFKYHPKISIVTPTWNTRKTHLEEMLRSVVGQTYSCWELCVADGNSSATALEVLKDYSRRDPRIKVRFLKKNMGIAANTNEALRMATGEYVAFLDHDDVLSPFALYEVLRKLNEEPLIDYLYSDEDKLVGSRRRDPFFKPDYSPDQLFSQNYICHFSICRRTMARRLMVRQGFDGSQDYDFVLRAIETARKVGHIPKVLYHWRIHPGSTAGDYGHKSYAWEAGRRALEEALVRRKIKGKVSYGRFPGNYHVERTILGRPMVSIIIPFKDKAGMLERCVGSILRESTYPRYEILLIDNGSVQGETAELLSRLRREKRIRIVNHPCPFNFSEINNRGVRLAKGSHIILLNNDTEVITPSWIEALLEHSQRTEVGAVGAKLCYPDDKLQHAGVTLGIGGVAVHPFKYQKRDDPGYFANGSIIRNVAAVTGACLMVKKNLYQKLGGLDERLAVAFNDVDFCLRLYERGYWNVYTPYAELYHYESVSRGLDKDTAGRGRFLKEENYMKRRYRRMLAQGDPFYNPNLSHTKEACSYRLHFE